MTDQTIKTIFFILCAIFVVVQIFAYRYDIKHCARRIWYGKEKYQLMKTILYTDVFFGKWDAHDVKKFKDAIQKLRKDYNFKFKGEIKRTANKKLLSFYSQGMSDYTQIV